MAQEQENAYRRAIELHNSGQRYPALNLVRENPKAAAVISKLTLDRRQPATHDSKGNRQITNMHTQELRGMASSTAQNIIDAESVTQMLPDIDLSAQILVSAILSPKDMMSVEPTYVSPAGRWKLPSQVSASLINTSRDYLDQVYKIKTLLPTMLHDILFRTGSYGIAVIPENSVDELINGTGEVKMESLYELLQDDGSFKAKGILGPLDKDTKKFSSSRTGFGMAMERLAMYEPAGQSSGKIVFKEGATEVDTRISVTDNFDLLKMPEVSMRIREQKTRKILGGGAQIRKITMESLGLTDHKLTNTMYQVPKTKFTNLAVLKSQDRLARRAVGNPLIIHIASEAIIPVHVPNRPDRQIGCFVLLDTDGNPISRNEGQDYYREMNRSLGAKDSFSSAMISRSKSALDDNSQMYSTQSIDSMRMVYQQMLEEDLMQRLRNGIVGGNVKIGQNEEVYRIMLARSLANQHTQLLYIPSEFMTYMALRFKGNGIGKSLLDDGKILTSMRCMLLVANVMTSLRNSIGRTHVNLKLDEKTPDPMKAIEQVMGELMRVNSAGMPLGTTNPMDIKDALQRAQYEFSITGHPGLPDMEVNFEQRNDSYPKPDLELDKLLRDRNLQLFGLTPEMVDASSGADFAASVLQNAVLMSKRVLTTQEKFTPQVSDNLRKVMVNSGDHIEELTKIIDGQFEEILKSLQIEDDDDKVTMSDGSKATKDEILKNRLLRTTVVREILEDYIANFEMQLPAPDMTKTDNQNDAYDKFEKLLDAGLNAWLTSDMFPKDISGNANEHTAMVRENIKAYFMRQFQIENGMLPELTKLTSTNEEGEPELDFASIMSDHSSPIIEIIGQLLKNTKKTRDKVDKVLEKAGVEEGTGGDGNGGGWGESGGAPGVDNGLGQGNAGGDDFGFNPSEGGDGLDLGDDLQGDGKGPDGNSDVPTEGEGTGEAAKTTNAELDPDEEPKQ